MTRRHLVGNTLVINKRVPNGYPWKQYEQCPPLCVPLCVRARRNSVSGGRCRHFESIAGRWASHVRSNSSRH
jgi:hypothetical protein